LSGRDAVKPEIAECVAHRRDLFTRSVGDHDDRTTRP
jgi:hypothetical protein